MMAGIGMNPHAETRFVNVVGKFDRFGDCIDVLGIALNQLILHLEVVFGVHRALLRHEVAYMAIRGEDFKILAKVLFQGFGFGRGFDDQETR